MPFRVGGADGVTGEYAPAPAKHPEARPQGRGIGAIGKAPRVDRKDRLSAVREGSFASLHSWELVTSVDGPGTRLTFFLSGCPLRCLYCHNPDTMEMRRGELVETNELVKRMHRYARIFERSGGGITLSGGEPLMQPAVVERLLREAKAAGIHTAIDTSGNLGINCTDDMLANLDLCLLDIKSGVAETYLEVTGADLNPTLQFARRLEEAGVEVWVRFVLVPGLTDAPENVKKVAKIAAGMGTCTRVEILPFHQMGRDKWAQLGMDYHLEEVEPPTAEQLDWARGVFAEQGLTVF